MNWFFILSIIYLAGIFGSTFILYRDKKISKRILVVAYTIAVIIFLGVFFLLKWRFGKTKVFDDFHYDLEVEKGVEL